VGSPDAVGLALSLGALDGLPDDVGLTLEDGLSVGTLTTGHAMPFSEVRTRANLKVVSMLSTLTVMFLPDTIPLHVPPPFNLANNSDSAYLMPSPPALVTVTLFPASMVPLLMPLFRLYVMNVSIADVSSILTSTNDEAVLL
jgi:hypothetical protein